MESSVLTRRRFLEQLGLAGGTSLVMSAMTSWDLMAGKPAGGLRSPAGRRDTRCSSWAPVFPAWSWRTSSASSGTTTTSSRRATASADWRGPCGAAPSTPRSAASARSARFDDGLYVNVGAWRIPYTHTGVLNYCRELGVPLEMFVNEAENAYFYYEGQRRRAPREHARAAARSQGRHDRLHERAARQGDRSGAARSPGDRRRQSSDS